MEALEAPSCWKGPWARTKSPKFSQGHGLCLHPFVRRGVLDHLSQWTSRSRRIIQSPTRESILGLHFMTQSLYGDVVFFKFLKHSGNGGSCVLSLFRIIKFRYLIH